MRHQLLWLATGILCMGSTMASAQSEKFLGGIWQWGTAGGAPAEFDQFFTQATPENAGKWAVAEPTRGKFNWKSLDAMYDWGDASGRLVKQHCFVWGSQQPSWIDNYTNADTIKAIVENWIRSYMQRYGDKVDMIDVVNEPLHQKPSYRAALGGDGQTGWDWVIWAFETTRKYAPNAKLILNDYDILKNSTNQQNYLTIIHALQDKGLIDGIGVQGHFIENKSAGDLSAALDRLGATGLPIYVSEYDVNEALDAFQLAILQEQFPVFWEHPSVAGVTLWGFQQDRIWRTDAYLVNSDGSDRPAMTWLRSYLASYNTTKAHGMILKPVQNSAPLFDNAVVDLYDLQGRTIVQRQGALPGSENALSPCSGHYIYRNKSTGATHRLLTTD